MSPFRLRLGPVYEKEFLCGAKMALMRKADLEQSQVLNDETNKIFENAKIIKRK